MSSKSPATWAFAHMMISRIWRVWGIALTAGTVLGFVLGSLAIAGWRPGAMFAVEYTDPIGFLLLAICGVQLAVFIGSIFPVERALRANFDNEGKPFTK